MTNNANNQGWISPGVYEIDYSHKAEFSSAASSVTHHAHPLPASREGVLVLNQEGEYEFGGGCSFPTCAL